MLAKTKDRFINFLCTLGLIADPQIMTINNVSASFRVTSASERWRVNQYMGEKPVLETFVSSIKPNDCIWDIGAAVGTYSCLAANAGAYPIAFEPHPINYDRCIENLKINNANGDVHDFALGNQTGTLQLSKDAKVGTGKHQISNDGELSISVKRGDDIDAPDPDIIKIDVEGYEQQVLFGMTRRLSTARVVFVECHSELQVESDKIQDLLSKQGFSVENIQTSRSEKYLIGINK